MNHTNSMGCSFSRWVKPLPRVLDLSLPQFAAVSRSSSFWRIETAPGGPHFTPTMGSGVAGVAPVPTGLLQLGFAGAVPGHKRRSSETVQMTPGRPGLDSKRDGSVTLHRRTVAICVGAILCGACASPVGIRVANPLAVQRYLTRNALTVGAPSDFSLNQLRRYDLTAAFKDDPGA